MREDRLLLPRGWHKALNIIHQIFVGICLVSLIALIVLLVLRNGADGSRLASLDFKIYSLFNGFFIWSFYGIVTTAIIFAIFTRWGFFRHKWLVIKWVFVAVLILMTMFLISPAISGLVAIRSGGFVIEGAKEEYSRLGGAAIPWLILEGLIIAGIKVLSKLKPWGGIPNIFKLKRETFLIISAVAVFVGLLFIATGFFNLQRIRNMTIEEPDLKKMENGRYIGKTEVGGFSYIVEVIITNHRIEDIKVLKNRNSSYARWAEAVIPRILKRQTLNVDAVTGATTTSKALMKTVSNSLQSDEEPDDLEN
jgi:uncharacterized protein with FMN-binding domain